MPRRLLALLLAAAPGLAQDGRQTAERFVAQEREAFAHYEARDYAKAVAAFERQIAIFPENPRPYYNIACCYGLEGNADRAATWLSLSIAHGWRDATHLAKDPDFDRVRQSAGYIACLAQLKKARELDPDPLPQLVPPASVPPAPSLPAALGDSYVAEALVKGMRGLYEQHEYRKRLFEVYDRRMAVLARYLIENGDAFDAADAAAARVQTALFYLDEGGRGGEGDEQLRDLAARYVLQTVEEFLRGWPGDPRLPEILLARVVALETLGRDAPAIELLRVIAKDHPAAAARAEVELCTLLPAGDELREVYRRLEARARGDEATARLMRARLGDARLRVEGMPHLLDLDRTGTVAAAVEAHDGLLAYVFVAPGDEACAERLRALPAASAKLLPVVVCVDREGADVESERWLKDNAGSLPAIAGGADAVERVWLREVPRVVVARKDGTVVAIDPDADELQRLAREG
jgi:tetratricopeptide (TPR) repeat protein